MEDDSDDESTHEEKCLKHDEEKMIPCTSIPLPPQANVTSQKSKHQENRSKRGSKVKKLEVIRKGAILPDNIWLSNHMSSTHMSKKEYNDRCESLRKNCNKTIECNAHTSLKNLRKISKGL